MHSRDLRLLPSRVLTQSSGQNKKKSLKQALSTNPLLGGAVPYPTPKRRLGSRAIEERRMEAYLKDAWPSLPLLGSSQIDQPASFLQTEP